MLTTLQEIQHKSLCALITEWERQDSEEALTEKESSIIQARIATAYHLLELLQKGT